MNSLRTIHKYEIIELLHSKYSFKILCAIANVSVSGFYSWKKRVVNNNNKEIENLISKIFFEYKGRIGIQRIKMELERKYNQIVNKKKIQRIKQKLGLKTQIRRKRKNYQGYLRSEKWCIADNILNRQFRQNSANRAYSTDVTYLITKNSRYYLSVIKDLCTKEIVAYKVSDKHDLALILGTLEQMPKQNNAIMHSDRGGLYTSFQYIQKLKELNLIRSMSRSGNCLDNAPIESFFGHLKDEIEYKKCKTLDEIRAKIDKYMYYYNNNRYQWGLNKMTPLEYKNLIALSY
ncbi:MAG: IS3 family transposase [Candidatus Gastranaerophilaceae bacterium]